MGLLDLRVDHPPNSLHATMPKVQTMFNELYGAVGDQVPTVARGIWAGAVTPTSFQVAFDVSRASSRVALVVSTHADLSSPITTTAEIATTQTEGLDLDPRPTGEPVYYYSVKINVTGLTASTTYYYAPRIDGTVQAGSIQRVKTFPTSGQPASFRVAFGSCSETPSADRPSRIYQAIAADNPLLFLHIGDMDYPNVVVDDIRVQRSRNSRAFRSQKSVLAMCASVPIAHIFDDHDSADNDNHWDSAYVSKATNAQVVANSRAAIRETVPIYPTVQTGLGEPDISRNILAQTFDIGRVRFLIPDCRSQRRYAVGTPTCLGHTSGHEYWDQYTWLVGALQGASAAGMKLIFLVSSSTWNGLVFDSWPKFFSVEQTALNDVIRNIDIPLVLLVGDSHEGAFDDGTYTDHSSTGDAKFPQIVSSGLQQPSVFSSAGPFSWNGADGATTGNSGIYCAIDVTDTGGNNVSWAAALKGQPVDSATYAPTTLSSVTSADAAVHVSWDSPATLRVPTGTTALVRVAKSWFGPMGGCSVNWASSNGGSGTLTFKPNCNAASFAFPDAGAPVTLTLSSPVGCSITGTNPVAVSYYSEETETATLVAAMTTAPSAARLAVINDMIAALKSASLWAKISNLYVPAAHSAQAGRLDWKTPGGTALTNHGASFVVDMGYAGDGTASYMASGYIPSTGAGFTQNSVHMGVWTLTDLVSGNGELGGGDFLINPRGGADDIRTRSSSATTDALILGRKGHIAWSRSSSASYTVYGDGAVLGVNTRASVALETTELWVCGWNKLTGTTTPGSQFGGRRNAIAHWGPTLNDAEMAALYAIFQTYLQSVGAA